jgi:protein involved in polysaccharide export with SLBB domain
MGEGVRLSVERADSVRRIFLEPVKALSAAILIVAASLSLALPAAAQTPEQLEIFRKLSPEQQRQVLKQLGKKGDETVNGSQPLESPATSQPKLTEDEYGTLLVEKEPRFRASDSLLVSIEVTPIPAGTPPQAADKERGLSEMRAGVLAGNPYRLDRTGVLSLPGVPPIVLAGLTAEQAMQRLNSEPALSEFTLEATLLPVELELKPFGYDLFSTVPTTFAPATDIPVPAEYVVGPGDTFELQLIGERGGRYSLTVGRDGVVDFPELGPIAVAGMRFAAAKAMLEQRVSEQMIGLRASVSMGALRSIQVFVLGEAERPGSYTVSGLSTITNALFASGGVKPIGSLRNIELKRSGQVVTGFDLYDLLLNGDTSHDARLLPGDVIFIPPVGTTVAISGEVQRQAIYELHEGAAASEILYLSGGLTPQADPRTARLERIDERRNRTVMDLDLTTPQGRAMRLQTGDVIRIQAIRESIEGAVSLLGHVHRAGSVQYRPGMRLTDLVGSLDELQPLADLHYVLILRETGPTRKVSAVSADLAAAFADPASSANVLLQPRDQAHVFDLATSRDRVIAPILDDLDRQSSRDAPLQVVGVGGHVKVPGQYPLEPGMTVSNLVRAGGGLDQGAYGGSAELARYEVIEGERRQVELIVIDMPRLLAGDPAADVALRPFDYLVIQEVPLWGEQETVTVEGEFRFPGTYPIRRGETLKSVIDRAGGLTSFAFPEGSIFLREDLKERERRQLEALSKRLQADLATLALQSAEGGDVSGASQGLAVGRQLLNQLQTTEPVGRLVIELPQVLAAQAGDALDVVLRDGDRLLVPKQSQEVTVLGEVQNGTSHFYRDGVGRDEYISLSGGLTSRADKGRIYVVRANGSVVANQSSGWFSRGSVGMHPGDTVVVPLEADRIRPLTLWTAVTTIIYNLAISVAAINSF